MGPVHDRNQVQEATLDWNVSEVRAPHVIGPLDGDSLESIGVHAVLGVRPGGPRRLVDGSPKSRPWWPDSHKSVSGKPGAVQLFPFFMLICHCWRPSFLVGSYGR